MNQNPRFPAHGLPAQRIELPRSYPFRSPMVNGIPNPGVHFMQFPGIPAPPQHTQFHPSASPVSAANLTLPHSFAAAPAPVDLRNQREPPGSAPIPAMKADDQPLDLSKKPSSSSKVADAFKSVCTAEISASIIYSHLILRDISFMTIYSGTHASVQ